MCMNMHVLSIIKHSGSLRNLKHPNTLNFDYKTFEYLECFKIEDLRHWDVLLLKIRLPDWFSK